MRSTKEVRSSAAYLFIVVSVQFFLSPRVVRRGRDALALLRCYLNFRLFHGIAQGGLIGYTFIVTFNMGNDLRTTLRADIKGFPGRTNVGFEISRVGDGQTDIAISQCYPVYLSLYARYQKYLEEREH